MSTEPHPVVPAAGAGRRRPWVIGAAGIAAVAALALGYWLWPRPPQPPLPDLADVDPEVVEAVTKARDAVGKAPSSGRAWGELGMVLRAHDFDDESSRCFEEAERLDPREARWPYFHGLTLILTDPDAGILCLERAVERGAYGPIEPRLRLAEVLLERGRLEEAQSHLEQALQRQPDNVRARLGLGRLALLREDWRGAVEHLAACLEDEHARTLACTLRAEAWNRLGEPERARADQERAGERHEDVRWPDPFVEEVLRLRCGLKARLETAGTLSGADRLALLEQTVAKYPQSVQARLQLGELWRQLGRFDRAEQSFQEAVRADPDAAEAWFSLGVVQAKDRPREAAESFRRAIRLKPDHAWAHFNLGHMLRTLGDPAGAADEYRAALRCRPDYAAARDALKELEAAEQGKTGKKP
jgi:tetratricopeptide (TPR) repeat protein